MRYLLMTPGPVESPDEIIGWIATSVTFEMLKDKQFVHSITSTILLRKVEIPKDIASAFVFLTSDKLTGHISGEVIIVA